MFFPGLFPRLFFFAGVRRRHLGVPVEQGGPPVKVILARPRRNFPGASACAGGLTPERGVPYEACPVCRAPVPNELVEKLREALAAGGGVAPLLE